MAEGRHPSRFGEELSAIIHIGGEGRVAEPLPFRLPLGIPFGDHFGPHLEVISELILDR